MGPDELDDLLATIRAEAKEESSGGALALYEGTRETDLVSESIDERILRLIGLEDVFDIDYGTYSTLLRERLAAARMTNSEIASDEDELLRDEFRRVRGKVGRFKISKKRISAGGLGVAGQIPISSNKFFLASKAVVPPDAGKEDGEEKTSPEIMDKLDQLIEAVRKDNKIEEKKQETERRQKQNQRRKEREDRLERVSKPIQRLMKKVVKPFQNILDRIMRFVQFTLLGFAFNKFIKWFGDPKNQNKIEVIGRFLKDWWPSLLGAAALFFTPLGKFAKVVVRTVRFLLPTITKLGKLLLKTKVGRAITAATTITALAAALASQRQASVEQQSDTLVDELSVDSGLFGLNFFGLNEGGMLPEKNIGDLRNNTMLPDRSASGLRDSDGRITRTSGLDITGAGPDTQLIAAAPGEIVIPKNTVEMYGSDYFMNMIRSSGSTGVPEMINGIQLANQGGMVGGLRLPGTGRVMKRRMPSSSQGGGQMESQFKFLGIPIPGTERIEPMTGRRDTTQYKTAPKPKSRSFVGDAFVNFGKNIQTIKDYGRRQEEMMRQLGVEPDGYTNLRGNPVMGPQSRVVPVGTPEVTTKMQTIVLPPTTMQAKKPTIPTFTGTKIPEFSITSRNTHRSVVSSVLGVSDLVG